MRLRSFIYVPLLFAAGTAAAQDSLPRGDAAQDRPEKILLVLGDSLSAAHQIGEAEGWVSLLQRRIEQRAGRRATPWRVVNASIPGETSDGGLARCTSLFARYRPAILVLELGANDGLRGLPPKRVQRNLAMIIEAAAEQGTETVLVGIRLPANYGEVYRDRFEAVYAALAEHYGLPLVPFLLAGVADHAEWMQADGLHPTAEAQPRLLDNVWPSLAPLLEAPADAGGAGRR